MSIKRDDIALVKTVNIPQFPETYIVKKPIIRRRYKEENKLECNPGDFILEKGRDKKGQTYFVCGKVNNKEICPVIGENNGIILGVNLKDDGKRITATADCGYTKKSITSEKSFNDYKNTFGRDKDFISLLSANCFQTTEECPIDPLTGKKMPLCSKFVSTTEVGKVCRQESLVPENSELIEVDMNAYCRDNTTADCRCINRNETLIYDSLKTGTVNDDGCWWKWCAQPEKFLVPPNIVNSTSQTKCPSVRKHIAREINSNLETIECCQIQQNVIYSPDGVTEQNVNCFFRDAQISQSSWFFKYGWGIMLVVIFIAIILVLLFIFMVHQRKCANGEISTYNSSY